jgi:hypothetical protein
MKLTTKFRRTHIEEVDVMNFNDFVEYGKLCTKNIKNGYPWAFTIKDVAVTHESDTLYIIGHMKFTINDLIVLKDDILTIVPRDEFMSTWEEV